MSTYKKRRATVDEIMSFIDRETEPSRMEKGDALDVLEQIETELQCRKDALREEMDNEEAEYDDEEDESVEDDDA